MKDLVTIIVPVYNGSRYIKDCIESIIYQSYSNLEIILVNDGSTDDSLTLLEKYKAIDERIIVIDQENRGVSLSRNAALDIASGKYICLVDQDDMIAPNYVEYYLDLIHKTHAEIALTPNAKRFCGTPIFRKKQEKKDIYNVISGKEAAIKMLYYEFIIAPWNKMISRMLIEKNNLRFDDRFFSGEGFLFSIECFQKANTVAIGNGEIYYYRLDNADSAMTKYRDSIVRSSIAAQKIIEEKIIDKTLDIMNACRYAKWHTYCDCLNMFVGSNAISENRDLYNAIKKYCQENALASLSAPVPYKEKLKAVLYGLNPYLSAKIINAFRKRKFTKNTEV